MTEDWTVCPVIVCDYCGEAIKKACEGNTLWEEAPPFGVDKHIDFKNTHKQCNRFFEKENPVEHGWSASELDETLYHLAQNCKRDRARGRRLAENLP